MELQERLNAMANRRDLWFPEFLDFLGIEDQRVRLMCTNDHQVALLVNQREFQNAQEFNGRVSDSQFLISENPQEYRRRATMSMHSGRHGTTPGPLMNRGTLRPNVARDEDREDKDFVLDSNSAQSNSQMMFDINDGSSTSQMIQIPKFVYPIADGWLHSQTSQEDGEDG